jgi:hypothetical protein
VADEATTCFEQFWLHDYNSLQSEYKDLVQEHSEADSVIQEVDKVLGDIVSLTGCTPASVGESATFKEVIENAKQDRINLCNALKGKGLFSALYDTYTITLNELKNVLQQSVKRSATAAAENAPLDSFREKGRGRKRNNTPDQEQSGKSNKKVNPRVSAVPIKTSPAIHPRNYYAPLRTVEMDTEKEDGEGQNSEVEKQQKTGRPPPIILTSATNLITLQAKLKVLVHVSFEFRNTRNGTRVITK